MLEGSPRRSSYSGSGRSFPRLGRRLKAWSNNLSSARSINRRLSWKISKESSPYLFILFLALIADTLLRWHRLQCSASKQRIPTIDWLLLFALSNGYCRYEIDRLSMAYNVNRLLARCAILFSLGREEMSSSPLVEAYQPRLGNGVTLHRFEEGAFAYFFQLAGVKGVDGEDVSVRS